MANNESENVENAQIGYDVAMATCQWEGELIWSKFNAMLVANSVVLAILGLTITYTGTRQLNLVTVVISIAGIVLSLLWGLLTRRGFYNYKYWIRCARELEGHLLPVESVHRGATYAKGDKVTFKIRDKDGKVIDDHFQLGSVIQHFNVETSSYLIISLFAVMYILALIYGLLV